MRTVRALSLLLLLACPLGAQTRSAPADSGRRAAILRGATRVGALQLTGADWAGPVILSAVFSATAQLLRRGEDPAEFYVTSTVRDSGTVVVLHLWHEAAFYPENASMQGNPGGKCRDMWYDVRRRAITKELFWQ
jgi:hypothetical protein